MIKDIQDIFGSITPENIKNIPAVKDAMGIFMETLEDLSKESIDIKNIFENDKIREELSKIYLDDLYSVLKAVESNQKLIKAIDRVNRLYNPPGTDPTSEDYVSYLKRDAITNVSKYITNDHFLSFRSYKENKGKIQALKYIYELLNVFTNNSIATLDFRILENGTPFNIDIEGTLPKEFYEYIVYPLAHPMGFTYSYVQFLNLILEDYFPAVNITYDVELLRTVSLRKDGTTSYDYYIVKDNKKASYGQTSLENKVLVDIQTYTEVNARIKEYYFEDGNYLKQTTTNLGQTSVSLFDNNETLIKKYEDQCSVEILYDFTVNTSVTDEDWLLNHTSEKDDFARTPIVPFDYIGGGAYIGNGGIIGGYTDDGYIGKLIGTGVIGNGDKIGGYVKGFIGDSFIGEGLIGLFEGGDKNRNFESARFDRESAPSPEKDLKILSGEYKVFDTYTDSDGNIVSVPLLYTDVVDPNLMVSDILPDVVGYNAQNRGNEEYVAREILINEANFPISDRYNNSDITIDGYDDDVLDEFSIEFATVFSDQFETDNILDEFDIRTGGDDADLYVTSIIEQNIVSSQISSITEEFIEPGEETIINFEISAGIDEFDVGDSQISLVVSPLSDKFEYNEHTANIGEFNLDGMYENDNVFGDGEYVLLTGETNEISEDISFNVFRDDQLLTDNNMSAV